MKNFLLFFVLFISIKTYSQNDATKIEITKVVYSASFGEESENLYKVFSKVISKKNEIQNLYKLLSEKNDESLLSKFGIDTISIKNNPEKLISLYDNRNDVSWNKEQRNFIIKELSNISNYKEKQKEYFDNGCCYSMHNYYRNQYIIKVYNNSTLLNEYKSRKFSYGYKFPWTDNLGNKIYNYKIEKIVEDVFNENSKNKQPLHDDELLKYLVNKIIESNINELYKLSAYSYIDDINGLKSNFKVDSFEEVYGRGRYIWDEGKTIKISLHNDEMLPNVNIQFLAEVVGKKLYTKDSLLLKYKRIVEKVQNINFVKNYLSQNPESKLDIYFFNNKPINDYDIDGVNKNPAEWKKQDDYIKSLDFYKKIT
ncbi:hypothetical protein SAMN05421847_2861 [Halpernia humi]|uniref:Uncharacterized protein n=1 Tax=Halpernia humi TaxID=493375 RepID=A0A1H6BFB1_9FLAO|nr:hypothetical protein [Halpernia humi]SEG59483.1 hypothetical protein SAMN05421847_2861 [Halpernia humi]